MTPARTVFIGTGAFGVEALRVLADHPAVLLAGVVTAPPRPAGRRQELAVPPIAVEARAHGIEPVLTPARLRDGDAMGAILGLDPELVVLADYGRIVPAPLLSTRFGALNLHPSLLPRHRGATPVPATILAGDEETGVTIIRMDEGIDTGPIVAASRRELHGTETAPELEALLAVDAAELLRSTLEAWLAGRIEPRPQDETAATMTRPLRREDGRLDPTRPAAELERAIRAHLPWPGSHLEAPRVGRLIVRSATAVAGRPDDLPGRLVADGDGLALTTVHGRLRLGQVQLAGRRAMDAATLRRGAPTLVDAEVA